MLLRGLASKTINAKALVKKFKNQPDQVYIKKQINLKKSTHLKNNRLFFGIFSYWKHQFKR